MGAGETDFLALFFVVVVVDRKESLTARRAFPGLILRLLLLSDGERLLLQKTCSIYSTRPALG